MWSKKQMPVPILLGGRRLRARASATIIPEVAELNDMSANAAAPTRAPTRVRVSGKLSTH